ncbi:MAG: metallophosphoesterase family protein [Burkholderiales bacterium]|nr:metallophosphoesterase family protein [Burkholderiales bacterium]
MLHFQKIFKGLSLSLLFITSQSTYANAQESSINLKFNKDHSFKIVQFTDIHTEDHHTDPDKKKYNLLGMSEAQYNYLTMSTILDKESPNLVVISGDVLSRSTSIEKDIDQVLKPIIERKIPWAFVMGNHDHEHGDGKKIISYLSALPYSLTELGPSNIDGEGNYVLQIKSSNQDKTSALIYMLDSHENSTLKNPDGTSADGYDWIHFNQINWYTQQSTEFTKNNNGTPYPALMFFHIPLPEYKEVWRAGKVFGSKLEEEASPKVNSGMFLALQQAQDVEGVFVGHDHVNDYIGYLNNIVLGYGRKTGIGSYVYPLEQGGRVIVMKEDSREFETWIRTRSNKKENFASVPSYFKNY